ncbi:hypothetical protein QJR52_06855 [Clostridium baratii]
MKVKELIEKLSEFDQELEVQYYCGEGWDLYDKDVTEVKIGWDGTVMIG